jgi:hypothetical protein
MKLRFDAVYNYVLVSEQGVLYTYIYVVSCRKTARLVLSMS